MKDKMPSQGIRRRLHNEEMAWRRKQYSSSWLARELDEGDKIRKLKGMVKEQGEDCTMGKWHE